MRLTGTDPTATPTLSPTPLPTIDITPTVTPAPTGVTTPTPTVELAVTPTPTSEVTPTVSPTAVPTPNVSATPTPTIDPTVTPTPTVGITPTATPKPTTTPTPIPTIAPTPTVVITPTNTPTPTKSVTPTATPTPTSKPTPTALPTPTIVITPTASLTAAPTLSPSPTATATPTISPSATPSATATPTPTPTTIPTPTPTITKVGNDISYPQCGKTLPIGQGFGIVGVNGGIATDTNSCLSTELLWAGQSLGTANQAKVQLYVNTGNPGGLGTSSWPITNTDPLGNITSNPYGGCDGSDSAACAWQYGWNRAVDDVHNKFIPAAQAAGVDAIPSDYPWWLDVETVNSWESGSVDVLAKNRADLEGMVAAFHAEGITVGIYSTSYQWGVIVGSVPSSSNLNGLPDWRPGAIDLTGAQSNCSLTPLTQGGSVIMTQYTTNFDYDYSCL